MSKKEIIQRLEKIDKEIDDLSKESENIAKIAYSFF